MKFVSCDVCASVYDQDKIAFLYDKFLDSEDEEERQTAHDFAEWDGSRYIPFHLCPICGGRILKE